MFQRRWPGCVLGVSLLLLAGCGALDSFGLGLRASSDGGLVLAGSAQAASQSAQDALNRIGIFAIAKQQGDVVTIAGTSPNGARFTLVFTEDRTKQPRQTRVRVEWDGPKDEAFGVQLLAALGGPAHADGAQK